MLKSHLTSKITLQDDEYIVVVIRKHWFVVLKESFGIIVFAIIPLLLLSIIASGSGPVSPVLTFVLTLWMLILWMALFTIWTDYYLDMWIVTDRRIINMDQISLFHREVSTVRIERIQDVSTTESGIIQTLLKFGSIRVQSAGAEDIIIHGIPHPQKIRNIIMEYVDIATEHKNKLTHTNELNPTRSE